MSTKIHIHTKYSLLDAMIEPEQLVKKLVEQGDTALCVTEHGNVYSNVEVYKLCKKYGIKYLYGCEMYICNDVNVKDKDDKYNHLVVIAKNETGRINLNKLVSESNHHKYYGKPRIDFNMLDKYKDGLIVLSACMAGQIQRAFMRGNVGLAEKIAFTFKEMFGDDYYLEYQSHSEQTQQMLNRQVVDLANKLGIKYVVTTDAHYLNKDDQKYHSIFVQIGQAREVGETYNDCYVQSDDDIMRICQSTTVEENKAALQTTNEIADKCNVEMPLSAPIMPHTEVPDGINSEIDYLKKLCIQGWYSKKINLKSNKDEYKRRLAYEIDVIEKMGFEGYYLFVWSYANSVKRRGIARGSGGGSLVAYLSNIVDIDPIEYGLYFERFIDVGALQLLKEGKITKKELKIPDFDLDFGKEDRNKVLQFVINKYGQNRVASLGQFQYIWAKGAIKDIGKVLGIPFEITNSMTSQLDGETISEVIELGLLDRYKDTYPELFDYAQRLAGLPKSFGSHPCGKVAAMDDIVFYNAVDINDNGEVIIQGDMHTAEDLGLIKADFLGLRTIDVIYDTLDMIGKDYEYIAPHNLNFDDDNIWKNFRNGFTSGVFQFESSGMRDTLKKIHCNSIEDLSVANALFRPGSMKFIDNYADRKKGIEQFEYLNPDLEKILSNTFGVIVFQEQLIEVGRLAKLSNPDELRKATAKKKAALLDKIKPELYDGLRNRGWTDEQLDKLWDAMLDFARYSFNKSHASAYALIAYICMYLKTYHSKEFVCAWINSIANSSVQDKYDRFADCVSEATRLGVHIYLGKYNNCSSKCVVYKNGVMIGTNTIKYCNSELANQLMDISKQKKHSTFIELLDALNGTVNDRMLRIIIGLGFFSDYGNNKYLIEVLNLYSGIKIQDPKTKKYKNVLPALRTVKQFSKDKIENYADYGLSEYLVKKYAGKETAKQYKEIDNVGLLNEMITRLENKSMPIIDYIRFEKEHLGYVTYINPDMSDYYYIVVDFRTGKDTTKPYFTLRNLKTGEETKTRIKQSKIYRANPFGEFSILKVDDFAMSFKKKLINGEWSTSDELEPIVEEYDVIKKV